MFVCFCCGVQAVTKQFNSCCDTAVVPRFTSLRYLYFFFFKLKHVLPAAASYHPQLKHLRTYAEDALVLGEGSRTGLPQAVPRGGPGEGREAFVVAVAPEASCEEVLAGSSSLCYTIHNILLYILYIYTEAFFFGMGDGWRQVGREALETAMRLLIATLTVRVERNTHYKSRCFCSFHDNSTRFYRDHLRGGGGGAFCIT